MVLYLLLESHIKHFYIFKSKVQNNIYLTFEIIVYCFKFTPITHPIIPVTAPTSIISIELKLSSNPTSIKLETIYKAII